MKHIVKAIQRAHEIADQLEAECPANQSDTPAEGVAHTLIHALRDAAMEAEGELP